MEEYNRVPRLSNTCTQLVEVRSRNFKIFLAQNVPLFLFFSLSIDMQKYFVHVQRTFFPFIKFLPTFYLYAHKPPNTVRSSLVIPITLRVKEYTRFVIKYLTGRRKRF